jgi:sialic acid synthase SpsE
VVSTATPRRCRIVVAIDSNHNGDPDVAGRLIEAARAAGADGIKLEKRTVAQAAVRQVLDRPAAAYATLGATYRKALERVDLPVEVIARLCGGAGPMETWIAPHDEEACRALTSVPFTAWKLEAAVAVHLPVVEALGRCTRPVIAAVAGCTEREVRTLVETVGGRLTLLHVIAAPSEGAGGVLEVAALASLAHFGHPVGYADASLDHAPALMAVALGAAVIEKRLTLDRTAAGPHHRVSLLPGELAELVARVRELETRLGAPRVSEPSPDALDDLEWHRVSIVAAQPITRGTTISRDMLALKPPSRGLSARFLGAVVGRRALYDIAEDEFVTFGMVDL